LPTRDGREQRDARSPGVTLSVQPTRVVIDCDTGVDDAMAILYGLLAPEIEIVGLTCCWGNIWVDTATLNTLRLLELMGRPEIPVAMGARKPLLGPVWELSHGVHGVDG